MDQENRAVKYRKNVSQVDVLNVKNVANGDVYFSRATLVDVSPTGLLLRVERENILALGLRSTLTLSTIIGEGVGFTIEIMDTYIEGLITRTKLEGHGIFVVAVDFREDAPEYWRQCLVDLLPDDDSDIESDADYPPEDGEEVDDENDDDSDQDPEDDEGLLD
jgi:hypothetical protein